MDQARVFGVSELTELLKNAIEEGFSDIALEGEISNWRPAPSGHVYFTLKDKGAMIQAVMFKGKAMRLSFKPCDGALVRAKGGLSVYAARGQYQIIVESMSRAGEGDMLLALEERKRRLAAEGLFDPDRKKPIPAFPARVAVITSPTGAAVRDILNVLKRRAQHLRVTILPSLVQGEEAPQSLIRQLKAANEFGLGQVIILARGGGSLEDLSAFSDEDLVRAVAASAIPVISAVGHEIDWSLCDYAADLRAPTPSAAAELVSESSLSILERLETAGETLATMLRSRLERARLALASFSADGLRLRLDRALRPGRQRYDEARQNLEDALSERLNLAGHRLSTATAVLCASDPMAILARGFSVVRLSGSTQALRDADCLKPGNRVDIRFARGTASASIEEIGT